MAFKEAPMREFCCGSVVPGCPAVFRADDDDGILLQVVEHALEDHHMTDMPPETAVRVRSQIRAAERVA
jgi:predicted small metal-binding protein